MTLALILYAFSLPDETNRLTPRFEWRAARRRRPE
jgi:hypothetical protein